MQSTTVLATNKIVGEIIRFANMKKITEEDVARIAATNMDKLDIYNKYENVDYPHLYGSVIVRRMIKKYAGAYGADFLKMYARTRCESATIEALLRSVPYSTCPDWFGDYFTKVYTEEISQ